MSYRPAKRKYERKEKAVEEEPTKLDAALYVQAHEADIVRGPQAWALAQSLEAQYAGNSQLQPATRLIMWNDSANKPEGDGVGAAEPIWVDRYDVRLLLDTLPPAEPPSAFESSRLSPTGWSDLPSDTEDTFFFSPDEVEDFHREKRRRMMDQNREERLRALRAELGEHGDAAQEQDAWGGSDEEPDEAQRELMRRTANHLHTSPNPAQLEMRILANHGADRRFAFMRGRWSRAWKITKRRVKLEQEAEQARKATEQQQKAGLGGLTGYGDSDASDSDIDDTVPKSQGDASSTSGPSPPAPDDALKEARRARAKEWAERRRALKLKTTE